MDNQSGLRPVAGGTPALPGPRRSVPARPEPRSADGSFFVPLLRISPAKWLPDGTSSHHFNLQCAAAYGRRSIRSPLAGRSASSGAFGSPAPATKLSSSSAAPHDRTGGGSGHVSSPRGGEKFRFEARCLRQPCGDFRPRPLHVTLLASIVVRAFPEPPVHGQGCELAFRVGTAFPIVSPNHVAFRPDCGKHPGFDALRRPAL